MKSDLVAYGENLAPLNLTETGLAVALLWYFGHTGEAAEKRASDLAALMHELALTGQINLSRFTQRLRADTRLVRGSGPGTFKIKLAQKAALTKKYAPLLKRPVAKPDNHVLVSDDFAGTRPYLEAIVRQINGTYQWGLFDACIVMCRRLIEILLIEAFERNGKSAAIKQNNNYVQLSDIIAAAQSGQHIKLARDTGRSLEEIKKAGDTGAHSRTYITKPHDIDHLTLTIRRVVAELMHLAKIEPKA